MAGILSTLVVLLNSGIGGGCGAKNLPDVSAGDIPSVAQFNTGKGERTCLQGSVNHVERKVSIRGLSLLKSETVSKDGEPKQVLESLTVDHYAKTQTLTKGNNWYRIPNWMAGEWLIEEQTQSYSHNLETGAESFESKLYMSRYQELWGELADKEGNIWKFERLPELSMVDLGEVIEAHDVKQVEVIEISKERVKLRYRIQVSHVDKKTQAVLSSNTVESVTEYIPLAKKVMKVQATLTKLNEKGQPVEISKRHWLASRTKSFEPIFVCQSRQLLPLFCEFLSFNGMEYLIPET